MEKEGRELSINKYKLDEEFINQPDLMLYFSEQLAEINRKVNDQEIKVEIEKDSLKALKANLELSYRGGEIPVSFKLTEASLEALVLNNEVVKLSQEKFFVSKKILNDFVEKRDKLAGIVDTIRHRKTSLEHLSNLYIAGYYSQPTSKDKINNTYLAQKAMLNKKEGDI